MDDEHLRRAADDVLAFYGGVQQQLAEHGIRGIPDLVESLERIRRAVATVRTADLERALIDVGQIIDRLRLVARRLETLAEMKASLGVSDGRSGGSAV